MKTYFSKALPVFCLVAACGTILYGQAPEVDDAGAEAAVSSGRAVISDEEEEDDGAVVIAAPTSAKEVLYGTISRLPYDPVTVYGRLIVRKPHGIEVREPIPFSMTLEWGAQPPRATYELQDGFGRVYQTLKIEHPKNQPVKMSAFDGAGKPLPEPVLTDSVHGTDFSWLDISLSFLWWENAELAGEDTFRGALCDLVVVKPPSKIEGLGSLRLWVDRKRGFLRQVEQFDEKGERTRWMWVGSVGKINDRWMIKTMEMKRPATGVQTKMQIEDMETEN